MSGNLTEETITEEVQRTFDTSTDERFRQLFVSLVQHLHDFAREWRLTGDEWFAAIDFLERVGKISSPTRQESVSMSTIPALRANHLSGVSPAGGRIGDSLGIPSAPSRRCTCGAMATSSCSPTVLAPGARRRVARGHQLGPGRMLGGTSPC